jgi:hypothetical protein
MAQHDYDVANADGLTVRGDLNAVLAAIVSNNSGASAPPTTFANMWWFDTSADVLYQRDEANTAWITVASKVGTTWIPYRSGVALGTASTYTAGTGSGQIPTAELVGLLARVGAWTRQQYFPPIDLDETTGGAVDWDLSTGQVAFMDLVASITMAAPLNQNQGGFYCLVVTQAGAGGYTITWNAAFNFGAVGAPALSAVVGNTDVLVFLSFGGQMLYLGIAKGF